MTQNNQQPGQYELTTIAERVRTGANNFAQFCEQELGLLALHGAICESVGYQRKHYITEQRTSDLVVDTTEPFSISDEFTAQLEREFYYDRLYPAHSLPVAEVASVSLLLRAKNRKATNDFARDFVSQFGDFSTQSMKRLTSTIPGWDMFRDGSAAVSLGEQERYAGHLHEVARTVGLGYFKRRRILKEKPLNIAPVAADPRSFR